MFLWLILIFLRIYATSNSQNWILIWNDEFNDQEIDYNLWNFDIGDGCDIDDCNWGTNQQQFYTNRTQNAFGNNGRLIIQALNEQWENFEFTSARMKTIGKGDWKFGKIEIRARFPRGRGILPQIWMLPSYEKFGKWPNSGHVDIAAQKLESSHDIYVTAISGSSQLDQNVWLKSFDFKNQSDFSEDFNVFSLEWEEDCLKWFVNGENIFLVTAKLFDVYPFNEKFHLLLSLGVGGDFVGAPMETIFPSWFEVDYVRIYQKF